MLGDSNYVTFWKTQNREDDTKISACQGHRGSGAQDEEEGHRGFQGSENIFYDTVMVDTCHYTFVKTKERTTQRVNPNVTYGLS